MTAEEAHQSKGKHAFRRSRIKERTSKAGTLTFDILFWVGNKAYCFLEDRRPTTHTFRDPAGSAGCTGALVIP
jgi:hypothetical protein